MPCPGRGPPGGACFPAGAPFLSACAERNGKRKSTSKGDTLLCPPWQSPRLKRVRGADVRRSAFIVPGAVVFAAFYGRDCVRGLRLFRRLPPQQRQRIGCADGDGESLVNLSVICASLLGVSKEGRESIPLWLVLFPYFLSSNRKYGRRRCGETRPRHQRGFCRV